MNLSLTSCCEERLNANCTWSNITQDKLNTTSFKGNWARFSLKKRASASKSWAGSRPPPSWPITAACMRASSARTRQMRSRGTGPSWTIPSNLISATGTMSGKRRSGTRWGLTLDCMLQSRGSLFGLTFWPSFPPGLIWSKLALAASFKSRT